MSAFFLYFIGFETINFYIFFIKMSILNQAYSFKNKELLKITKNAGGHSFVQRCFVKLCTKFQGSRACCSGTGARRTWQPMIFTGFTSSSLSKFPPHSAFNLTRGTSSFYECYIFSFVIIFTKNINTTGKTHVIL